MVGLLVVNFESTVSYRQSLCIARNVHVLSPVTCIWGIPVHAMYSVTIKTGSYRCLNKPLNANQKILFLPLPWLWKSRISKNWRKLKNCDLWKGVGGFDTGWQSCTQGCDGIRQLKGYRCSLPNLSDHISAKVDSAERTSLFSADWLQWKIIKADRSYQ